MSGSIERKPAQLCVPCTCERHRACHKSHRSLLVSPQAADRSLHPTTPKASINPTHKRAQTDGRSFPNATNLTLWTEAGAQFAHLTQGLDLGTDWYCAADGKTPRNPSCTNEATDKKSAGATKASFMKKCEREHSSARELQGLPLGRQTLQPIQTAGSPGAKSGIGTKRTLVRDKRFRLMTQSRQDIYSAAADRVWYPSGVAVFHC